MRGKCTRLVWLFPLNSHAFGQGTLVKVKNSCLFEWIIYLFCIKNWMFAYLMSMDGSTNIL
jgi:hypothetical protein